MPLALANSDTDLTIMKVRGNSETKTHLQNLGFVDGAPIRIVVKNAGNLICNIKGSRIAITSEMAMKIMVQ